MISSLNINDRIVYIKDDRVFEVLSFILDGYSAYGTDH